jgi:hypothetical protein
VPRRRPGIALPPAACVRIAAAIAASAVVAAYFWFGRGDQPALSTTQETPEAGTPQEPPQQPLGGDPYAIDLPPLDASDALVRELVKQISAHPRIAAWLATDNLIRNFTAAVVSVAEGKSPRTQLAVLRPSSTMRIVERDGSPYIDPKSYERYNAVAEAVASLDPLDAARLYATLRPRIEEAYRELGLPDTPFDRTLERAILRLLETPVVKDPVRLQPLEEGIGYGFADPRLQNLTDAQKQLLRMGSRNVLIIEGALREIAVALGIAPTRLLGATSASRR